MREPLTSRGEPVFFVCAHFTECAIESVRTEKWIVAEAFVASRRPGGDSVDLAFEFLNVTIGPGET